MGVPVPALCRDTGFNRHFRAGFVYPQIHRQMRNSAVRFEQLLLQKRKRLKEMSVIALLTDFGNEDPFVGVMKGVILTITPRTHLIDLTHQIPPQNVALAAFHLLTAYPYFPLNTIFCCVVDPGVGTDRRAIAVQTERYFFVAPDNGLLSWVLRKENVQHIVELCNPQYQLPQPSSTFHGRDLFAPAAAFLARGVPLKQFGPSVTPEQLVALPFPFPEKHGEEIRGAVVAIDHFGNCITSIYADDLPKGIQSATVSIGLRAVEGIHRTFADVPPGAPVAYIGSFGYLEVALRNGNLAAEWNVQVGDPVIVRVPQ